jgi:hypothetical protein
MDDDRVLTPAEGADRIAARHRERRRLPEDPRPEEGAGQDDDDDEAATPSYTCENCGEHGFFVLRHFSENQTIRQTLPCSCGATDTAATRELQQTRTQTWAGRLGIEHRPDWHDEEFEDMEEIGDIEEEELESDADCKRCLKRARPDD